ncbi:MAG: TrkA C-terminal domain-containing protein, partial [Anaerolineales bacterium]
DIIHIKMPKALVGQSIAEAQVREQTRCTIIALQRGEEIDFNLDIQAPLPAGVELVMLGTSAAEEKFRKIFKARL